MLIQIRFRTTGVIPLRQDCVVTTALRVLAGCDMSEGFLPFKQHGNPTMKEDKEVASAIEEFMTQHLTQ